MSACVKCGSNFVGTPENPPQAGLCRYCEIDELKAYSATLRKALEDLVGANSREELEGMIRFLNLAHVNAEDQTAAIAAIRVLLDTLPMKSAELAPEAKP